MRRGLASTAFPLLVAVVLAWSVRPLPAAATFAGLNGNITYGSIDGRIVSVDPRTGAIDFLTSGGSDWAPAWSPDGTMIAFTRDEGITSNIYVMRADGSGLRRLVTSAVKPAWSPDGGRIAFASPGSSGIGVADADGSNRVQLTDGNDDDPSWSPDGTRIAFWASRIVGGRYDIDIYTIEPDGSDETRLTFARGYDFSPDWSPDGSKIVFSSWRAAELGDIYVMNADGTGTRRLTDDPDYDVNPVWSPDGSQIAWEVCGREQQEQGIAVMDADGTDARLVTNRLYPCTGAYPSWGPLPPVVRVPIDIKPGTSGNPVNLGSGGVLAVAILTTDAVDARDVLVSSVCFGDAGSLSQRDCSERGASLRDVGGDGRTDLVLRFEVRRTGIDPGDRSACLNGRTRPGLRFVGCDRIHVVPM